MQKREKDEGLIKGIKTMRDIEGRRKIVIYKIKKKEKGHKKICGFEERKRRSGSDIWKEEK